MEFSKEKDLEIELERLTRQMSWYKSFFDNATDAVFMIQPESWVVLDLNDYAATVLKSKKESILGTVIPQFKRINKLLKKSNSQVILCELNLDTSDNSEIMLEVSARFIDYNGQQLIQAIARDVNEQSVLTEKLVQADKLVLLGQLSAGIAHEIRNPLAAVNLNLQVLKRNLEDDTAEYNQVDKALQGVERISRIVEVTLNFSKPTIPEVIEIDLNEIIPTAIELVSTAIRRKEINLDLQFADNLPNIAADSRQIQQVYINLLKNAADAIETKGTITIKTFIEETEKGKYVTSSITDTGIGIQSEDLNKIFNPFFTRKPDGTGLGLPITQRIIHQHNGIIEVDSSFGTGTTFYVKIPIPFN